MERKFISLSSILTILILYIVNQVIDPVYWVKNIIKWAVFAGAPFLYYKLLAAEGMGRLIQLKKYKIRKRDLIISIGTGMIFFFTIIGTYWSLLPLIDSAYIVKTIEAQNSVTLPIALSVGAYVIVLNSFIEEFFFRGYVFLKLYEKGYKQMAYVFSALLFALYHIGIFQTWFNDQITFLALVGLFMSGLGFAFLDRASGTIIYSWVAHAIADIALMLIAFQLIVI